jgi:hypothetical protein
MSEEKSKSNYKFICRDGEITIPKQEFDNIIYKDWFINKVFEYDNIDTFNIWEDKQIVLTILDSVRYNKLIFNDNINLNYLLVLAEKWCVPTNIIDEINYKIKQTNIIDILLPEVKQCKNCKIGYKETENTSNSCQIHDDIFINHGKNHHCCGISSTDHSHEKRLGCKKGFHIQQNLTQIHLDYLTKLL